MGRAGRTYVLLATLYALSLLAHAQEAESAWNLSLDSITVTGYRYSSPVKSGLNGMTVWDMSAMSRLPQILGNADPMRYAQMLPGIQTNNEYNSGIHIEGCDNQHNLVAIEGVPIYNASHLLGFFSAFNTDHFKAMSIAKGVAGAFSPNRIGGQVEMRHAEALADSLSGSLSVGLISSQCTLHVPVSRGTAVTASARGSYMNLLYGSWLRQGSQQVKYSFLDANVTVTHRLGDRHSLLLDFYHGNDRAHLDEGHYLAEMKAAWGNTMGALHWIYEDESGLTGRSSAYLTHYRNRFGLDMQDVSFNLPSSITDAGLRSDMAWGRWAWGIEAVWHRVTPQYLEYQGGLNVGGDDAPSLRSLETSVYAEYQQPLSAGLQVAGGTRASVFAGDGMTRGAIDPTVRLQYSRPAVEVSAVYALRHQYLFQTGFSDMGLPTEFWLPSTRDVKPQYAHELSVGAGVWLAGRRFKVSMDLFYKRLYHQLAYRGSVLDFFNTVYDLNSSLMHGRGENRGMSVTVHKCSGRLTGWVSYTYTRARRSFDAERHRDSYPASHERPHELNAVLTYRAARHWNGGATLVMASGTPYTPAESLYLLNGNIVMRYGRYNSARLRPYLRLDLSAGYTWATPRGTEHGINVSLYNATSRENELFYYLNTHSDGSFAYRPAAFFLRVLPSLSYHMSF